MASEPVIRLRPDKSGWAIVALVVAMTGVFVGTTRFAPGSTDTVGSDCLLISYCAFVLSLPAIIAAWLLVFRVQADAEGLRWRDFRGSHYAAWSEVTDYYFRLSASNKKLNDRLVVEIGSKKLWLDSRWSGDIDGFKNCVREHATNARVSSWQLQGNRLELDGVGKFYYRSADSTARQIIFWCAFLFGPIITLVVLSPKIPNVLREDDRSSALLFIGLQALAFNLVTLFSLIIRPSIRDVRERRHQSLLVSCEGVTYEEKDRPIVFIPWQEIQALEMPSVGGTSAPQHYTIVGDGKSITFSILIHPVRLLRTILLARSINLPEGRREWKYVGPETELLGGPPARWTGGSEGVGERVFTYRNRSLRALLWLASFYLIGTQMPALEAALGLNERYIFDGWSIVYFLVPATLLAWLYWRNRAAGIVLSGSGITERAPFGPRTIRWSDVKTYGKFADDSPLVGGVLHGIHGERVRFSMCINEAKELMEIITARAVQASGTWKGANEIVDAD